MDRFEANRLKRKKPLLQNLHSSMDRFEDAMPALFFLLHSDLHSSMDRFEAEKNRNYRFEETYIYIPVWIDLKKAATIEINLDDTIYIPVWIDLKQKQQQVQDMFLFIYIPVWIDLKTDTICFSNNNLRFTFQYG